MSLYLPASDGVIEAPMEIGWCRQHDAVMHRFDDGSGQCMWSLIVEAHSEDHDFITFATALEAGILVEGVHPQ